MEGLRESSSGSRPRMTGLSTGWRITRSSSVELERHARQFVLASGPVSRISRGRRGAGEQPDAADEARASDEASPLICWADSEEQGTGCVAESGFTRRISVAA